MTRKPNTSNKKIYAAVMLLAFIVIVPFFQVLWHDFITLDDPTYVISNEQVKKGLSFAGLKWALTTMYSANWHPITWLSHMLDYQLFGLNPMGHHLMNLLIHLANTLLLFSVLRRMTEAVWRSAFVAALFGVHPLHVESVAWVAERKDVLSTLFWMLTMHAYSRYAQSPTIKTYLLVVVIFTFGLMSKPMLVTLPFVLLILDYWPLERIGSSGLMPIVTSRNFRTLLFEKISLFFLSGISCVITLSAQGRGGAIQSLEEFTLGVRLANAVVAYASYLIKMIWPYHLIVYYPHPGSNLPAWQVLASGFFLALITFIAIMLGRKYRYLAVGWLWYLGTLVPVIGLVQVGMQAIADRYTYVPLIGIFIAITWGVPALIKPHETCKRVGGKQIAFSILKSSAALSILALAICTWIQVGYWKDSFSLFRHTLAVCPQNAVAHYNLGVAFVNNGDAEAAMVEFQKALNIKPGYPDAWYNIGVLLQRKGKIDEAIKSYYQAIKLDPTLVQARNNLAIMLFIKGNYAEAWKEVHACMKYGFQPHPEFLKALSQKMPEP
ncbi:MAG: tetratricopeptide repeat protein [Armatimonadetes bacterium]|nr:tetratricopeptide repeat protein [Armatimonadota bacterium]